MITSGEFPGLDLPDIDTSSSLGGLGAVELNHPTQDIDGDGILDSITTQGEDAMQVWTDFDQDGIADQVTIVENDGDYAAWEFHRHPDGSSEWKRTDQGKIGE
ncbi:hypothetical protein IU433_18770 [Nocardia puris]|uniref:DUF6802 domain-containing protein n=1 Tax=Nocardia puris TaxID=208602 RepID=A0A366DFK7_9NOCA|nr:DUF6802 family protein [Nocardia puris]MBF6212490.1 hypothetical protein [Nocardia puris]MBF6366737.1 hypothetical protein [Nocardia puris]MBF6461079.1 hypothetical protein [Nocardia puris]RBO88850.1 hypothetical protein DFR74_10875 [Nocardia puris]